MNRKTGFYFGFYSNRSLVVAAVFALFSAFLLTSCSSRQQIDVLENGDISCKVEIKLTDMFLNYLEDLSALAGVSESGEASFFDIAEIEKSFEEIDGITFQKAYSPSTEVLNLEFIVNSGAKAIEAGEASDIFTFSGADASGVKTLSFRLNLENYSKIEKSFGISENPVLLGFTPQVDNPYTTEEYYDIIDFIFEDYTANAAKILEKSFIEVEMNVRGEIISATAEGGSVTVSESNKQAVFKAPTVVFLTLENPIAFEVKYK